MEGARPPALRTTAAAWAVRNPGMAPLSAASKPGSKLSQALFDVLQWYTSFFYWAAGIYWGVSRGTVQGAWTYASSVLYELYHLFGRQPPTPVTKAAARTAAPEPSSPPQQQQVKSRAAAVAKTSPIGR